MAVLKEDVVKIGFDIDMAELVRLTSALDDVKKILTAGIGKDAFDDLQKGLKNTDEKAEEANKEMRKLGNTNFDKTISGLDSMTGKLGTIAVNIGKVIATGIAAGAAGVGAIVAESVKNYADYEQLVGGVDTLFKTMSGTVQKNAEEAWRTSGLSANAYMETVTSFSASLIQSLGGDTAKAAAYADMAIIDMSDNANKMGTDISSIQDAYQGFAKKNYTMLDNLKLGYGGTQEEMKRLLADATAISGIKYDISSYADVVAAIHVIQEEMGIAGTTAAEASDTISGSFNAMKAAWSNTLTSLILGGEDYERCIDNLVESAKTFGKNIMPAITKALAGVGSLIEDLAPMLEKELPEIIDLLLPPLIKAATSLFKGLIVALPSVIRTLVDELPTILAEVWKAFGEAFGEIPGMEKATAFFNDIIKFITDHSDTIKKFVPVVLALVVGFKLLSAINTATGLLGGGGVGGGGFFSTFASMNPTTALKGVLNLIIVIGGLALLAAAIMAASPYMAKLSDGKSIAEVLIVMTAVGILGFAMTKLAANVGYVPVSTVAKGVANIAIVMLALGALAAVLMYLAPSLAAMSDMKSVGEVLLVIAVVGLLGTGLAYLAGLVGKVPVTTVVTGVANVAIALFGFGVLAAALMYLAPYMAQLSDTKTTFKILLMISAVGLIGSALAGLAGLVGMIPITTVLSGVANVAIALLGFGLLATALMWLAPKIDQLADVQTTFKILLIIGATGLIGSALAGLAGLIGVIPIATILSGLLNIALALGGFTLIVTAFGLLTKIAGFNEFLTKGGEVLVQLCGILGSMVGTAIGKFGEGVTNSLPTIGTNLSDFATNVSSAVTTFSGLDSAGLSDFAGAFGKFILVITGEKILGAITGGVDYAGLGTKLSSMTTNLSSFFTDVEAIPDGAFEKATALFKCLAGIESMPKEGGVVGWFMGEVDYRKMADGLTNLGGAFGFFTDVNKIPEEAFSKASALFECLAGVKALPNDGGVVGWFMGEIDYSKIANGIKQLGSAEMIAAITAISAIPAEGFTALTTMFETLAGVKALPKEGGVVGWFTGDNTTGLTNVSNNLPGVATSIAAFFTNLGGITDFTPITALFDALAGIKTMPKEGGIADWFTGDNTTALTNISSKLPGVATDIAAFFTNLGGRTDFTPIKSLFDTLSNIKIDSDVVDDGFLGLGESKMEEMGKGLNAFASSASTFFNTINTLNVENLRTFFNFIETAGQLPTALSSLDTTLAGTLSTIYTTVDTKMGEIKQSIADHMGEALTTLQSLETGFNTSGAAAVQGLINGMNSMLPSLITTARSMAAAVQSAFDVELDINSPSKVMEQKGEFTGIGAVIGLRNMIPEARSAAQDFAMAATPYGNYTPEGSASTYNTSSSEVTNVSPVFNLNISGSQDDRALARKVKRYVAQAVSDTLESFERKTYVVREV